MSSHDEWWAERDLSFQLQIIGLYGMLFVLSIAIALEENDSALFVPAWICLLAILISLRRAGQYRYSQTRNTVVER